MMTEPQPDCSASPSPSGGGLPSMTVHDKTLTHVTGMTEDGAEGADGVVA